MMRPTLPFTESEISVGPLGGMLVAVPDIAARPIVIILPGSGPTDRDGNSQLGIRAATYRLLAEALARQGVSSIRIDKRGLFSSRDAASDPNAATIADYAEDAGIWLDKAREISGAGRIWLIGHSEGGLVALVTATARDDFEGLILLAVPGRPLGDVIRTQLRANPANAPLLAEAMAGIDALEHGRRFDTATLHPALKPLLREEVQPYLIDACAYDPVTLLRKHAKPTLIVQGTKDIQVSIKDASLLAGARGNITLALLTDVNHVLKTVPQDDRAANIATYGDPDLPLSQAVPDAIVNYMNRV